MKKNCLITGGAGFIGSHLGEALLKRGDSVRILDNFSTGKRENLKVLKGAEIIEGDIRDLETCRKACKGIDVIFHEAALPSVERSLIDPIATEQSNILGMLHVLKAAHEAQVKKLIYAGSSSVYGANQVFPAHEELPMAPLSPYGASKASAELLCRSFAYSFGFPTISLRYFNVFGPRQDPDSQYSGVIAKFTKMILNGVQPTIDGDGGQSRDFTYVENVVVGNLLAADTDIKPGEVMNLALGNEITVNQLFETLCKLLSKDMKPKYGSPRKGDIRRSFAKIDKAKSLLGFKPVVEFEEGMRRTVEWYKSAN